MNECPRIADAIGGPKGGRGEEVVKGIISPGMPWSGTGPRLPWFTRLGVALLFVGGALVTTATLAAAATPTITFKQSTPLAAGASLVVNIKGSGFTPKSIGALFECNTQTPQPTIDTIVPSGAANIDLGQIPVSCAIGDTVVITTTGTIPTGTQYGLVTGALGPPALGVDSAGNQSGNDAANFPCPPASTSGGCELLFVDQAKETATATIQFSGQSTTTTTNGSTTSTTAPCDAKPASMTATNAKTGTQATVTVTPATCLVSGQTITVSAQGLTPSLGTIIECNGTGSSGAYNGTDGATLQSIASGTLAMSQLLGTPDKSGSLYIATSGGYATLAYTSVAVSGTNATFSGLSISNGQGSSTVKQGAFIAEGQPSVTYLANAIPVSCTQVKTFQTNSDGTIGSQYQSFTVVEGTTGPPCGGSPTVPCDSANDSGGGSPTTDAKSFPCPPTSAQTTAGAFCVIAVGDLGGDKVAVPISFNIGAPPIATTTTSPSSGGELTSSGGGGSTSSSGGSLAFTGSGPGVSVIGILGLLFVLVGGLCLLLVDAPRRLLLAAARRVPRRVMNGPKT